MGPDLSRVGASRSISYLIDSIRRPDKELSSGMLDPNNHYGPQLVHDTVTVVTAGVEKITGVARNEDTFSVQLKKSTEGRSGRAAVADRSGSLLRSGSETIPNLEFMRES